MPGQHNRRPHTTLCRPQWHHGDVTGSRTLNPLDQADQDYASDGHVFHHGDTASPQTRFALCLPLKMSPSTFHEAPNAEAHPRGFAASAAATYWACSQDSRRMILKRSNAVRSHSAFHLILFRCFRIELVARRTDCLDFVRPHFNDATDRKFPLSHIL